MRDPSTAVASRSRLKGRICRTALVGTMYSTSSLLRNGMGGCGVSQGPDTLPLVPCATEEKPYWDINGQRPQQHHHAVPPDTSPDKLDQGFMSKLSVTEIGTAYDSLTKSIGGQARALGGQAKTFGEQAKGYTLANTSTAAAAMNRFKKQVASAMDGVPMRPDDDHFREHGTTTADKEKAGSAEDSQRLLQGSKENGEREGEDAEAKETEGAQTAQHPGLAGEEAPAPASLAAAVPAAGSDAKRVQATGGMVDESAPTLSFGALAAAFKKKPAGGATVTQAQAGDGGGHVATSGAVIAQSDSSASGGGSGGGKGGGSRSGGDVDAEGLKVLPRTASLVGGRQWAVVASVFDTTASVIDETVGDLFT